VEFPLVVGELDLSVGATLGFSARRPDRWLTPAKAHQTGLALVPGRRQDGGVAPDAPRDAVYSVSDPNGARR
jgi:hypothetical protein